MYDEDDDPVAWLESLETLVWKLRELGCPRALLVAATRQQLKRVKMLGKNPLLTVSGRLGSQ